MPGGAPGPDAGLTSSVGSGTPPRTRDALLIGLTFVAGIVDAVSYLGLGQIFTANMTGNIVFLAIAVGTASSLTALRSVDALIGFCLGAMLAGRVFGRASEPGVWGPRVTAVLAGEIALMGAFAAGWVGTGGRPGGDFLYALVALSSLGMGMQNAAARHMSVPGLTTTVVTTALTGIMAEFAALGISGPTHRRAIVAVVALFSGAAVGAALVLLARPWPPVLTVASLTVIVAIAFVKLGPRTSFSPS